MTLSAAIHGSRGYVGGELMRLLQHHPDVGRLVVTSGSRPGRLVEHDHPPLRGSGLTYTHPDRVGATDVAFLAGPHGSSYELLGTDAVRADRIVDLTADHRLSSPGLMARYYDWTRDESRPAFVCGIPELHRADIAAATRVAVPGCMATATILMLHPLTRAGLVERVHVDARTGSSGSGASGTSSADQHAARAGALRIFAPTGHRHEAEAAEQLRADVTLTVTATPQVRGIQTVSAVELPTTTVRSLRELYADTYRGEPFVRLLTQARGAFRHPDPKVMLGSNFCDIAVAGAPGQDGGAGPDGATFVLMAALDNLGKGAAGAAVQVFNLMCGLDERAGLAFPGLHPV